MDIYNIIRRIINVTINRSPEDAQKKIAILERKQDFPGRLRTAIDEAKEENNLSPADFLSRIESKLADWLSENWDVVRIDKSKGLNCDRDTEAEVELAIRFFPKVLSMKRNGRWPIFWQLSSLYGECNLKAASFVPLFAKLAIELNQFTEEERGGLICGELNVLRNLAENFRHENDKDYHQLVDETFLVVIKRLRESGLFKKDDMKKCDMIRNLCGRRDSFPEHRFRYLVDWDPSCLMMPSSSGWLPIQYVVLRCNFIQGFKTVLEVGVQHFPQEMAGLFLFRLHWDGDRRTAYQIACKKFGNEEVKEILKNILNDGFIKNHKNINALLKSLVYAATVKTAHLDGVFEILQKVLQRETSVLQVQAVASHNMNTNMNTKSGKWENNTCRQPSSLAY